MKNLKEKKGNCLIFLGQKGKGKTRRKKKRKIPTYIMYTHTRLLGIGFLHYNLGIFKLAFGEELIKQG